ncbi:sensor histidine kinase [Alicyclobacillus fastidiosus]|uniref:histidine kinase n=1 Tax=Alicyclobacillus fastidiosus TaxID=392011 RepID=A0ABV5A984_9BACL|nr:HAMP domain-containing sensor histidine kinase [Alicyclobacillus fastidiosus]WEH10775.1 HAMP domain-containing sensor histidine kinase [Alicyclobacillus fastidiosus]
MIGRTLSARITWWSVVWCAIVLLIFTMIYTVSFHARSVQSYKHVLQLEMAALLGQGLDKIVEQDDSSNWERYVAVTDSAVRLTDDEGNVLFQIASPSFTSARIDQIVNSESGSGSDAQVSGPAGTQTKWDQSYQWHDGKGTHHAIVATRQVSFQNGTSGTLQVFSITDELAKETWRTFEWLAALDVLILALFAVGMRWFTRRGLRPLNLLMEGIQEVEWNQSPRLNLPKVPGEVESLQQSINQLLDRIDKGVQEQNRFIADASHELRTPLAIIAGHANLLRRWGRENVRVWEPAVRNINSEVARLQKLVNQLLLMAKLEEAPQRCVEGLTSADIQALFGQLRQDAAVLRPDLDIVVRVHMTSQARAFMDLDDLHQVLVVLIDNALGHTQVGRVELAAHGDEGMVRFTVSDTGEGIHPDVVPHVFDRFYRADAARGSSRGSGLGLAICKQIVESYQGKIYLRSKPGRGTTVIVRMPMQEPEGLEHVVPGQLHGHGMEPKEMPIDESRRIAYTDAVEH